MSFLTAAARQADRSRKRLCQFRALLALGLTPLISACVTYEPARLVPAISLSPEDIQLVEGGTTQAVLDFGVEVVANESDSLFALEALPGVRVRSIDGGGPADSAGIQVGDIILEINGMTSNSPDALVALQAQPAEAEPYRFVVQRDTTVFESSVIPRQLATQQAPIELYRVDPIASRAGYETALVEVEGRGRVAAARVVRLLDQSPLPEAGIGMGDMVLSLENRFIGSAQDLVTRLNTQHEPGDEVTLGIYDGSRFAQVDVSLWDPGRRISRIALGPLLQYQSSLSPPGASLSILDFWLFSVYSFNRVESERSHSLFGLINYSTDVGELTELESQD